MKSVLIVDDDADIRELVLFKLEQAGYEVRSAPDGEIGLEEALSGMLASPHFLFRVERAVGPATSGVLRVDDHTKASRLSFLLWNAAPDDALLTAAQKGELSTKEGLQRQADRLTASPRLAEGVSAFFDDMLQMDKFATQTKDSQRFPKYSQVLADEARQQTLKTLVDMLVTKNGDYRDVFTTRDTFMTRTLALVYKVPYLSKDKWATYHFGDDSGRAGVITQSSFLSLFSHPAESSPTKRGVALNEIFLCQPTPPPPNNVDFTAVNPEGPNKAKTVRLRLEILEIGAYIEEMMRNGGADQFKKNVMRDMDRRRDFYCPEEELRKTA